MKTTNPLILAVAMVAAATTGVGQPVLQFSAPSYTVPENAGSVNLTVQRTGDTNTDVGVDYATTDGTATNGLKYTAVSGTLTFGGGKTNQVIAVPILNNGFVEGNKNFQIVLSNPTGGAVLGTRTNATVSITDNDTGVLFHFDTYAVSEDAGAVVIDVGRPDDGTNTVSVDFFTSDLTATNGVDYTGVTTNLVFAPLERYKLVPIPILNNTIRQGNRTFRATLANPVNASPGSPNVTTVTILDNDQGFAFESATYSVAEDAGVARINVLRGTDDTSSVVTVVFATSDLSAVYGLDYLGLTNTLTFAPGERLKQVFIPILNDGVKEGNKNFGVALSNPGSGAMLGSKTTARVTIVDNDPGVGLELTAYSVWENAGTLTVNVLRGNDVALGPITVDYATSNLTAQAGQDYQAISGTLVFQQDETVKSIDVAILRDAVVTNDNSFRIILSNPTGGASLGKGSATVTIVNANEPGTFRAVAPSFDTALRIEREGDVNILSWAGGGQLQRADNPAGPWQTIPIATNSYTVQSPIPTTFYRVTRPRPVNVYVPSTYNGTNEMPLVILLHGFTTTGGWQEDYMRFRPLAEARGFLYCYPDSTIDRDGNQFWNATDACCDVYNTGVDDAGYLRTLIEEIGRQFSVDRKRIHLIGHSNGGYMAYRMACDSADIIAGIASLAGVTHLVPTRCQPSEPVNILHIHGTADQNVSYFGDAWNPGALRSMQLWAEYNGASGPVTESAPSMDLDLAVLGPDTVLTAYTNHPPGGAVELWTINRGTHQPIFYTSSSASEFAPRVIDWLFAHPKP